MDHFKVNMMNQGQSSNPPMNQASDSQATFQPMESRQEQQPQHQPPVMQTPTIPSMQHIQDPLGMPMNYQQQFQQQQALFAKQQEQLKQQLEYQKRLEQQIAYQQQLL